MQISASYDPVLHLINEELKPNTLVNSPNSQLPSCCQDLNPRAPILKCFAFLPGSLRPGALGSQCIWPVCPPGARAARDTSWLASPPPLHQEATYGTLESEGSLWDSLGLLFLLHPWEQAFLWPCSFLYSLSRHPSSSLLSVFESCIIWGYRPLQRSQGLWVYTSRSHS